MSMTSVHIPRALPVEAAFLLLTAFSDAALGQPAPPIGPGARVRVSHTDRCCRSPQVGTLVSVSADSVVLRAGREPATAVVALPKRAVSSLALGYDAGHYTRRGAAIGAGTGVVVGITLGLTVNCEDDDICQSFRPYFAAVGGAIFGAGGLVLGALIGRSIVREQWVPIPLPDRVGLAPAPGGGLAVRLALRL